MEAVLEAIRSFFEMAGFSHLTLKSLVLVIMMPIAMVYLLGRCLNVLGDRLSKNIAAVITVFSIASLELFGRFIPGKTSRWLPMVEDWLFLICIGVFVYTVLWQRFYNRADKRLDRVIGDDGDGKLDENGFPIRKKK